MKTKGRRPACACPHADRRKTEDGRRKAAFDWSKVPVFMTGTPNPEALRLLAEAIWEWQLTVDSDPSSTLRSAQREVTQVVEDVVDVDASSS